MAEEIRPVLMWCSMNPTDIVKVENSLEVEPSSLSSPKEEEIILENAVEHSVPVVVPTPLKQIIQEDSHFEPSLSIEEALVMHCQDMTDEVNQENVDYDLTSNGYGDIVIDVDMKPDPDFIIQDDTIHAERDEEKCCSFIAEVVSSQASVENGGSLWQEEGQENTSLTVFEGKTDNGHGTVTKVNIGDDNRLTENSKEQEAVTNYSVSDSDNEKLSFNRSEQKLKHKCKVCNRWFNRKSNLRRHMFSHTDERPHECTVCHSRFKIIHDMKIHMKVLHSNAQDHKCTVCNKKFRWSSCFKRHMLVHTDKRPHKCTFCHMTFKSYCDLSKHKKLHKEIRSKWAEADNGHETAAEVYISDDDHLSENYEEQDAVVTNCLVSDAEKEKLSFNHNCTVCNKQFSHISNLRSHMFSHTDERPHKCTICHRTFKAVYDMKMHMKIHKEIGSGNSLGLIDKGVEDCLNKKCYVLLSRIKSLQSQLHLKWVEKGTCNRANINVERNSVSPKRKDPISFSVVDNSKGSRDSSGNPLKTKLITKACKCSICNKLFKSSGNLRHHLIIHTDQKLCRCNGCNKQFNSIIKLNRHMMINHVKLKPLKCSVCGKVFKSSLCLKIHVKQHAKEENVKSTKETEEEGGDISDPQIQLFDNKHKRQDTNNTLSRPKEMAKIIQINDKHKEIEIVIKNFDGKKQFICSYCGKIFLRLFNVRRHIASHNPDDPFECGYCDKTFKVVYDLNKHIKCHKPPDSTMRDMNCEKDGQKESEAHVEEDLDSPNHRMLTYDKGHENLESMMPSNSQSGENDGFTESEDVDLQEDKQETINANEIMSQSQEDGTKDDDINGEIPLLRIHDKMKYVCSKCGKRIPTLKGLRRHIASHNPKEPFKCTSCGMCFKVAYILNKHMKTHDTNVEANDMPLNSQSGQKDGFTETEDVDLPDSMGPACEVNKDKNNENKFLSKVGTADGNDNVSRQKITILSSTINGKQQFKCSMCGKKFPRLFSARRHVVLHYPERPYKCTLCTKDFKVIYDLNKHMKSHPDVNLVSKLVCHASSIAAFSHKHTSKALPERSIEQISTNSKAIPEQPIEQISTNSKALPKRPIQQISTTLKAFPEQILVIKEDSPDSGILRHDEHETLELDATNGQSKCQEDDNDIDEQSFNDDDGLESNTTRYSCTKCGKTFKLLSDLNKHLEEHSQDDQKSSLLCSICGKVFPKAFRLNRHIASHLSEKPYQCHICKKSFGIIYNLNRHMKLNHGDTEFPCHLCQKIFHSLQLLKKHQQTHLKRTFNNQGNMTRYYSCTMCDKKFKRLNDLNRHLEKHSQDDPTVSGVQNDQKSGLVCSICGIQFPRMFNLKRHMASHSLEKPYQCHICKKSFGIIYNLNTHMKLRHGGLEFSCHVCKKIFLSFNGLKHHQKTRTFCKENFELIPDMNERMETHVEMTGNCLTRHRLKQNIVEEIVCFICGQIFDEKYELKKHMKEHNDDNEISIKDEELSPLIEGKSDSNDKTYKCCICDKRFQGSDNLLKHSSTHYDLGRLKCMDCDKLESDKSSLERHYLMIHVRIVPFRCAVCSKIFQSQKEFKIHLKIHIALNEHRDWGSTNASPFLSGLKFSNEEIEKEKIAKQIEIECNENVEWNDHLLQESKLLFKCCLCIYDNELVGKHGLREHMSIHCDSEKLICKGCGKKTIDRPNLKKHAMEAHSKMIPINCSLCFELLQNVTDYELHMKSHDPSDETPSEPVNLMDGEVEPNSTEFDGVREGDKDNVKESSPVMDDDIYECCICKNDNRFEGKMNLRKHLSIHCDIEMLRCMECGKTTSLKSNLIRHLMAVHVKMYPGAQMLSEIKFERLKPPEVVLMKEYSSVCQIETGSDDIVYKCLICNDGNHFVGKINIKKHVLTHCDLEIFICYGCDHVLGKRSSLKRHMMVVHVKMVPLKCSECLEVLKSITDLNNHMKVHKALNGLRNNDNCNEPSSSSSHSREVLVTDFDHDDDKNGEVSFNPTVVTALPNDSERFNVNNSDDAITKKIESDEIYDSENLLFSCCICNNKERLKGKKQVSRHMSIHCDLEQKKCIICNKGWRFRRDLKRHMAATHAKMFQVKCVLCCEILENLSAFQGHMKVHRDKKLEVNQLYECCVCEDDNILEGKMNIRNHMSIHCNFEMLRCLKCGHRATYKSNLKRHMIYCHVKMVPQCVQTLNKKEIDRDRENGNSTLDRERENGNLNLDRDRENGNLTLDRERENGNVTLDRDMENGNLNLDRERENGNLNLDRERENGNVTLDRDMENGNLNLDRDRESGNVTLDRDSESSNVTIDRDRENGNVTLDRDR